jgi:hypothetical protein
MVVKALAMVMTFARHGKYFNKRVLSLLYLKKDFFFLAKG